MRDPRSFDTLETKAKRNQWTGVIVVGSLAVFMMVAGIGFYTLNAAPPAAAAIYVVVGLVFLGFAARISQVRYSSNDFTLAERVIYEVTSLARACSRYNEALPYPAELARKASVCRRYAGALLRSLTPYLSTPDPQTERRDEPDAGLPNLFVDELTTFADQMAVVLRSLGGIVLKRDRVPQEVISGLEQLRPALEKNWKRLDETHLEQLRSAARAVQLTGVAPDQQLTATWGQLAAKRLRSSTTALSSTWQLALLVVIGTTGLGVFSWVSTEVGNPLTVQEAFQDYMFVLTLVVIFWAAIRRSS